MNCLVVEDDSLLRNALERTLKDWGASVECVASLAAGLAALTSSPHLVVFDIGLPDGSGVAIAEAASRLRPLPMMVAISGKATGPEGFKLARLGVLGYLPKPLSLADFTKTLERILAEAPDLVPTLVTAVGREPFQNVLTRLRRAMVEQALALSQGNKTVAAKLLGVTRQAVQQQIRDLDLNELDLNSNVERQPSNTKVDPGG